MKKPGLDYGRKAKFSNTWIQKLVQTHPSNQKIVVRMKI